MIYLTTDLRIKIDESNIGFKSSRIKSAFVKYTLLGPRVKITFKDKDGILKHSVECDGVFNNYEKNLEIAFELFKVHMQIKSGQIAKSKLEFHDSKTVSFAELERRGPVKSVKPKIELTQLNEEDQ